MAFFRRGAPGVKKIVTSYDMDGLTFKSRGLRDAYQNFKQAKNDKLVNSFHIPTAEETLKTKFGAQKCQVNDITFASIMEARYYIYLLQQKKEGLVKTFELQPVYELQPAYKKTGRKIRPITYIADYRVFYSDGKNYVIDVKGKETVEFKLKRKLFDYVFPDLTLICVSYDAKTQVWSDIHKHSSTPKQTSSAEDEECQKMKNLKPSKKNLKKNSSKSKSGKK